MNMYLVLLAYNSTSVFSLDTIKSSGFYSMYAYPVYYHHQHKPEPDVFHLISSCPGLPENSKLCSVKESYKRWRYSISLFQAILKETFHTKSGLPGLCYTLHSYTYLLNL
jgi:hypothetical protein